MIAARAVLLFVLVIAGCASESEIDALPEQVAGFRGEALTRGPQFVRRVYRRGRARIDVTVANGVTTDESYAEWVRASAAYPKADIGIDDALGYGFYDCAGSGSDAFCSAHFQFRADAHVEVIGGGTATRRDLDDLLRQLPLRRLAIARSRKFGTMDPAR